MKAVVTYLPVFIPASFPVLYLGGHSSSETMSAVGIAMLLLGMSGSIIKRVSNRN